MAITQEELNRLYSVVSEKIEDLKERSYYKNFSKNELKHALYRSLRYHFILRYSSLHSRKRHPSNSLSRLFKSDSLLKFGTPLSEDTIMLNKLLSKAVDDICQEKKTSFVDIETMLDNMNKFTEELDAINKEGNKLRTELDKIPGFLESGKWE